MPAYIYYLQELRELYMALEQHLREHAAHPALSLLVRPEIFRSQALGQDLEQLTDLCSDTYHAEPHAGRRYASHLKDLAEEMPAALLSHAYVRYLGDMSGGQMIGQAIERQFDLPNELGTNFYSFPQIADLDRFKEDFRNWIDDAPLSDIERCHVMEEAVRGFDLSSTIFEEVEQVIVRQPQ